MKTNALQRQYVLAAEAPSSEKANRGSPEKPIPPQRAEPTLAISEFYEGNYLRMYTEEEVSAMLRVSLSQLRKWRIKSNKGRVDGPPFKKVGRLVRYPGRALQAYIDGD